MRKRIIALMTAGLMVLAGCSAADAVPERPNGNAREPGIKPESELEQPETGSASASESEKLEKEEQTTQEETGGSGQEDSAGSYEVKEPDQEQYTWQEITVTLPEDWVGRCVMEETEMGFSIYQKAAYEKDDMQGYICSFIRTLEPEEYGMILIAYTEEGTLYYLAQPMDVACDIEDEAVVGEYIRMCQQVPLLKTSMRIASSGIHGSADEYMLPTSSIFRLDSDMLEGMSDNNLWIARNEIYARHGRQFDNMYLQQYFDRCTWYEGGILAEEFPESVLSQTERDNLQLLNAAEEGYGLRHPYPMLYQASDTAKEDLNGDGTVDEISYRVEEQENGEFLCEITVNGESYIANEFSCLELETEMTNPMMDCFYITDILEDDGVLEIAVLDEGASEDPVTHFYRYDGSLSYIGQVWGFPFAEMNGGYNGFNGYGVIAGELRTDLIETAYLQGSWRYDGGRITQWDWGWYDYLPSSSHILYEDLPVYLEREETSVVAVIPAQQEVFFLGTDGERWILVKGKDGSQGYMLVENGNIVELNKPAQEVFSGLQFSD